MESETMKPLIGINMSISDKDPSKYQIGQAYTNAILQSGGIPILLSPVSNRDLDAILPRLNGLMMIGGHDYNPAIYGQELHPETILVDPKRQDFDIRLLKRAMQIADFPILLICAGEQLLNILLQGTLDQHVPDAYPKSTIEHRTVDKSNPSHHPVELLVGCQLAKIYGTTWIEQVVSSHHQAVRKIGNGLLLVGWAPDGVPEALEMPNRRFVIAVQWHPEVEYESNQCLFKAFIREATRFARIPNGSSRRSTGRNSKNFARREKNSTRSAKSSARTSNHSSKRPRNS